MIEGEENPFEAAKASGFKIERIPKGAAVCERVRPVRRDRGPATGGRGVEEVPA